MNKNTYDFLYKKVIEPSINKVYEKHQNNSFKISMVDLESHKEDIFRQYTSIRNNVKEKYYPKPTSKVKIDNHKIAACFTQAFILNKVFSYDIYDESLPAGIELMNYELAFDIGIGILYSTLINYYHSIKNNHALEKLLSWKCLKFPRTTLGHNKYKDGRIKTLALNDLYENGFDVLTYADKLFWIEHYNRQLLENKIDIEYIDLSDYLQGG